MIYDPCGVKFSGDKPNVYHSKSEQGNATQRGFCGTCGSVLFNHVSEVRMPEIVLRGLCFSHAYSETGQVG